MAGKRFAYEEYVRKSDQWYWGRTKELVATAEKRMTALVAASTVISVVVVIAVTFRLRRYQ